MSKRGTLGGTSGVVHWTASVRIASIPFMCFPVWAAASAAGLAGRGKWHFKHFLHSLVYLVGVAQLQNQCQTVLLEAGEVPVLAEEGGAAAAGVEECGAVASRGLVSQRWSKHPLKPQLLQTCFNARICLGMLP